MIECPYCRAPKVEHAAPLECVRALSRALAELVVASGEPGSCRGCGASIYWIKNRRGKSVPYTPQGFNHFIDCARADDFRKAKPIVGRGNPEKVQGND